jgi:uncharacterized membrane protein YqaE (UPF0057 family)
LTCINGQEYQGFLTDTLLLAISLVVVCYVAAMVVALFVR